MQAKPKDLASEPSSPSYGVHYYLRLVAQAVSDRSLSEQQLAEITEGVLARFRDEGVCDQEIIRRVRCCVFH
jgi:hypothetical protein